MTASCLSSVDQQPSTLVNVNQQSIIGRSGRDASRTTIKDLAGWEGPDTQCRPRPPVGIAADCDACTHAHKIKKVFKRSRIQAELMIYPGYFEVKYNLGVVTQKGGGLRGEVKSFSRGSRANYKKKFGRIPEDKYPTLWLDLTLADDVVTDDMTIREVGILSSKIMRRFGQWVQYHYPDVYILWKREWKDRKSGVHVGMMVPHYHCLIGSSAPGSRPGLDMGLVLAQQWVKLTRTKDLRALKVALDPESMRLIKSALRARKYALGYAGKMDHIVQKESTGRYWGVVGDLPEAEGITKKLSLKEEIWVRRIASRMLNKKRSLFRKHILKSETVFYFMMQQSTFDRILQWVNSGGFSPQVTKDMLLEYQDILLNHKPLGLSL